MTPSADFQREVLERMDDLGRGRTLTASVIAHHGQPRSVTAVWRALEALWERRQVEDRGEGRFVLPAPAGGAELVHDQMTIGEC